MKKMIQVPKLTIDDVRAGMEACARKAAEVGVPMDIAVVDDAGHLPAFERMNGGLIGCIQIAIDKAFTSAVLGLRTEEEGKIAQPGGPDFGINTSIGGRIIIFGVGIPAKYGNRVVGAVGCSSGTVDEDSAVAQAGVDAIEERLKKQK